MTLQAGRLRDFISIRRPTDISDGKGAYRRGWQNIADRLPAEVIGQSGREAVIATTLQGTATYRITIRYREGLKANDQIIWRDQELNILAPPSDPDGRREQLQILADTSSPQKAGE